MRVVCTNEIDLANASDNLDVVIRCPRGAVRNSAIGHPSQFRWRSVARRVSAWPHHEAGYWDDPPAWLPRVLAEQAVELKAWRARRGTLNGWRPVVGLDGVGVSSHGWADLFANPLDRLSSNASPRHWFNPNGRRELARQVHDAASSLSRFWLEMGLRPPILYVDDNDVPNHQEVIRWPLIETLEKNEAMLSWRMLGDLSARDAVARLPRLTPASPRNATTERSLADWRGLMWEAASWSQREGVDEPFFSGMGMSELQMSTVRWNGVHAPDPQRGYEPWAFSGRGYNVSRFAQTHSMVPFYAMGQVDDEQFKQRARVRASAVAAGSRPIVPAITVIGQPDSGGVPHSRERFEWCLALARELAGPHGWCLLWWDDSQRGRTGPQVGPKTGPTQEELDLTLRLCG